MFRLRPLNDVPVELPHVPLSRADKPRVHAPVEEQHAERTFVTPDREAYEIERREATLVHKYREHLRRQGHEVGRLRVVPAGESAQRESRSRRRQRRLPEGRGVGTRLAPRATGRCWPCSLGLAARQLCRLRILIIPRSLRHHDRPMHRRMDRAVVGEGARLGEGERERRPRRHGMVKRAPSAVTVCATPCCLLVQVTL